MGLPPICGATGSSSCCATLPVPAGTVLRSYDVGTDAQFPNASFPASVSAFDLDKYEITVGRFRAFVAAGQGTSTNPPAVGAGAHPSLANSGWSASWNASLSSSTDGLIAALACDPSYASWTNVPAGNETRPINCITWYEAMAFCAWDAGYLPTEAEWNYAATGGDQQRTYPWATPPGSLAIDSGRASFGCLGDGTAGCTAADLRGVGELSAGDGRWGHSDLAGNVWEWTLDWYATPYSNPCTDCADLSAASFRVHRGGGFRNTEVSSRTATRGYDPTTYRASDVGGRCARP
jgi:sulfatase modifying factor 1